MAQAHAGAQPPLLAVARTCGPPLSCGRQWTPHLCRSPRTHPRAQARGSRRRCPARSAADRMSAQGDWDRHPDAWRQYRSAYPMHERGCRPPGWRSASAARLRSPDCRVSDRRSVAPGKRHRTGRFPLAPWPRPRGPASTRGSPAWRDSRDPAIPAATVPARSVCMAGRSVRHRRCGSFADYRGARAPSPGCAERTRQPDRRHRRAPVRSSARGHRYRRAWGTAGAGGHPRSRTTARLPARA